MPFKEEVEQQNQNVDTLNSKQTITKKHHLIHCVLKRHHLSNHNNISTNDDNNMNQNRSNGIGMIASMFMKYIHSSSSCIKKRYDYQLSFSLQKLQQNNYKKNHDDDDDNKNTTNCRDVVVYDEILLFVARKMNMHTYLIYQVEENDDMIMIGTLIRNHDNISYVTYDLYDNSKNNHIIATILYHHITSKFIPLLLLSSSNTKQSFSSSLVLSSLTRKAEFAIAVPATKTSSIVSNISSNDNNNPSTKVAVENNVSNKEFAATISKDNDDIVRNNITLNNNNHVHHHSHDNWFEVECSKRLKHNSSLSLSPSKTSKQKKYDSTENNATTINDYHDHYHHINVFQTKEPYVKQKCDDCLNERNNNYNHLKKTTKKMKKTTVVGLNFQGRGRMASSKNIQFISMNSHHHDDYRNDSDKKMIISSPSNHNISNNNNTGDININKNKKKRDNNKVMYQMSKWDDNVFHIDYSIDSHIEMIHAFALGIAQLDL